MSLDNRKLWHGTPGAPIFWPNDAERAPRREITDEVGMLDSTLTQAEAGVAQHKGYTGIPCDHCGSLNTIRNGACLLCTDCHSSGECG